MSNKQVKNERTRQVFSESAKKAIVKELEQGLGKLEASRKYNVSRTSIYKWLDKYSTNYTKSRKVVVESKEEADTYVHLQSEVDRLYNLLGRSQTEVILLSKLIELASEEFGIDLKKNYATKLSAISKSKKEK